MPLFQRRPPAHRPDPAPLPAVSSNGHGNVESPGRGREAYYDLKTRIHRQLIERLDLTKVDLLPLETVQQQIRRIVEDMLASDDTPLSRQEREQLVLEVEHETFGLGPLEPLMQDPTVSDILVNGCKEVFIERRGKLERTRVIFRDNSHLLQVIERIVSGVGRRVDESSPMVDARLPDGSRVNAIIPPLALDGPVLSIRRFAADPYRMADLVEFGTLTSSLAEIIRAAVQARLNILVSGGTGAGKTTMLNVLSNAIPNTERIVTIEDSAELQLQQEHVVRLETRPPNIEGQGAVTQRDLVRNALRMRPDRIVVGEVRGGEVLDMLQAMNTGHDGSLTTIHANTPRDALARVENMVSMTGISFPAKALRSQIASAIDIVIQVERQEDGRRRVVSLQEINGMEGDIITTSEIFRFERRGLGADGQVLGELVTTGIVPGFERRLKERGVELPVALFRRAQDLQLTGSQRA